MEVNSSRTLFLLFEQYNTPAVPYLPYFDIFNNIRAEPYLILAL